MLAVQVLLCAVIVIGLGLWLAKSGKNDDNPLTEGAGNLFAVLGGLALLLVPLIAIVLFIRMIWNS